MILSKTTPYLVDLDSKAAEGGEIIKIVESVSDDFSGFGELYSSVVIEGHFRGWKLHKRMTSLIFCTQGSMSFHFICGTSCTTLNLETVIDSKQALVIPAGTLFGFKSLMGISSVVNLASEAHDPEEVERPSMEIHNCEWLS